jgi:hypothetical protein
LAERSLDEGGVSGMRNQATGATKDSGFGGFGFFTPAQELPENIQIRFEGVRRVPPKAPVRRNFLIQR